MPFSVEHDTQEEYISDDALTRMKQIPVKAVPSFELEICGWDSARKVFGMSKSGPNCRFWAVDAFGNKGLLNCPGTAIFCEF